jgi:hypothetical protein
MRLLTCLFLASTFAGTATQIPQVSFEEVVHGSQQIVTGRVLRSWVAWGPSHEFLWTHYDVQVEGVVKGNPGSTITISEPGGILGGRGMDIAGAVHYEAGEHVMLFLNKTPVGYYRTVGWSQGKYQIAADGTVHATAARPDTYIGASGNHSGRASIEGLSVASARSAVHSIINKAAVTK